MNRIDRLTAMLIHLQSKRVVKAQELADRFAISIRTVYRDIRALETAGVPIGAEAGIGYYLAPGYHLPPVMFSEAEARALLLSGKLVAQYTDPSIREAYESALFKIRSVMDDREQETLSDLEPHIQVHNAFASEPRSPHLQALQIAIAERRLVRMRYHANYNEARTERTVEPIGLSHQGYGWHLIAYCRLRQDYRDFRTDRIAELVVLPQHYAAHQRLDLETYYQQLQEQYQMQEVLIRFDNAVRPFLGERKYLMGFVGEERHDTCFEASFLVISLETFARWLLMYGDSLEILSPAPLKTIFRELTQKIYRQQQGS